MTEKSIPIFASISHRNRISIVLKFIRNPSANMFKVSEKNGLTIGTR